MDSEKLTVFFEEPFWVGVFERITDSKLSVCKITFGAEPKDFEIYEFILKNYCKLQFSPSVAIAVKKAGKNPKRLHREIHRQLNTVGLGTKSQQALKLQQEQSKAERKVKISEKRELEKQRKFEQKRQKHKNKHKGK